MTLALAEYMDPQAAAKIESVLMTGDLAPLNSNERVLYHNAVCKSVGLNPLTQPFEYINLNGKLKLYAKKAATDQLSSIYKIVLEVVSQVTDADIRVVTVRARAQDGRQTDEIGCVPIANLKGEALANAMMKAVTKAKRRAVMSICGLGMLDETEVDSIPGATRTAFQSHGAPPVAGPLLPPPAAAPTPAATPATATPAPAKAEVAWPYLSDSRVANEQDVAAMQKRWKSITDKFNGLSDDAKKAFKTMLAKATKDVGIAPGAFVGPMENYEIWLSTVQKRADEILNPAKSAAELEAAEVFGG